MVKRGDFRESKDACAVAASSSNGANKNMVEYKSNNFDGNCGESLSVDV